MDKPTEAHPKSHCWDGADPDLISPLHTQGPSFLQGSQSPNSVRASSESLEYRVVASCPYGDQLSLQAFDSILKGGGGVVLWLQ